MIKKLWFDTETTGTDPYKNDIIQIAGIIEIDGKVVEEFNLKCRPHNIDNVSAEALEVTGLTLDEIKKWENPGFAFNKLIKIFEKHITKFDKQDKFTPCGHNVKFDLDMLQSFFKKNGDKYGSGTWQNWQAIDTIAFARIINDSYPLQIPDFKLGTLAEKFNIEIQAHDALSDIRATKQLYEELKKYYGQKIAK